MHFPKEFQNSIAQLLAPEEQKLFWEAIGREPTTSIRLHPHKYAGDHQGSSLPWSSLGKKLISRPSFTRDPVFHGGGYYVQDASSQVLEHVYTSHLDFSQELRVLDLCAAPGGKSTHLLSLMDGRGLLVANEVIAKRAQILRENIVKWGYANVIVTQKEAWQFKELEGYFDVVLVDAPCSGEGLFRKDPAALEEWSPELVELSAQRQKRIIADIWATIKPGGHLIYSTCTYNSKEDEENVAWIATELGGRVLSTAVPKDWKVHVANIGKGNGLRFFPQDDGGEGFFVSILQKSSTEEPSSKRKPSKSSWKEARDKEVLDWLIDPEYYVLYERESTLYAFPKYLKLDADLLSQLSPMYMGVAVAERKGKVLVPQHALAMSGALKQDTFPRIQLSQEQAIIYLKKEPLSVQAPDGYALVTFQDIPLGWIKVIGKRSNNLYPMEWRIRK